MDPGNGRAEWFEDAECNLSKSLIAGKKEIK